jgi:hypothetical protein
LLDTIPVGRPLGGSAERPFEQLLSADLRWAMSEGGLFFEGQGRVQKSLSRIARKFEELGIPYAVAGGMALFAHGHHRFTEDVDILLTRQDIDRVHEALDGRGWTRPFSKSKNLRDADTGVRIEFLVSGDYPGDGKPKAVQFPPPQDVAVEIGGVKYLNLPTFIELKLASGMTGGPHRAKDLVDVGELIKAADLPESLADSLNPYVRTAYLDLWRQLRAAPQCFMTSIDDAGSRVEQMLADGVTREERAGREPRLVTTDPDLAKKYGMHDETEFLDH